MQSAAGVAADHRVHLAAVIAEFAQDLLTDFDTEDVLRRLCGRLPDVLPIDGAGVSLVEESEPRFAYASPPDLAEVEREQARTGEGPCYDVLERNAPIAAPDLTRETRWRRFVPAARAAGISSITALPMTARNRVWGVLDLYSRAPLALSEEDLAAARLLADVATNYVLHARDRDVRQAAENALRAQALHDPLTGLPNRVLLMDRLEQALALTARAPESVAVLFCDLDRFKQVNDTYGHAAGDRLLLGVTRALHAALRPGDTLARLSGDEFVVLCLDQHRPAQTAEHVGARLLAAVEQPIQVGGHTVRVSASIGIAYAEQGSTPEGLLHAADAAMYQAKASPDQRFAVHDRQARVTSPTLLQTEAELATALADGDLRLVYQPVFDLRSGSTAGAEALVRWQHPQRGLLAPRDFLPAAEVTGQISAVGRWVTRTACAALQALPASTRARSLMSGFRLAVNASPRELHHPDFVPHLRQALQETGISPRLLCLEVTEASLIDDLDNTSEVLHEVRDLGAQVAVDDFGTGFSSLAYLHRLPVDVLKIDQSFVQALTTTSTGKLIISHVVDLAHALGLTVTAEGIETAQQHERLRDLGCDRGQGFALARPSDALTVP